MTNPVQQMPYLRVQRNFPEDNPQALTVELDRAYVDTATKINEREIAIYAVGNQIVTGQQWYFQGGNTRQQSLRQIYEVPGYGAYPHGINFATVSTFTIIAGIGYNGTSYVPIPYVDVNNIGNGINIYVDPTNININPGGVTPPALISAVIILEWVSQF